jgi:hypothetical protein
MSSGKVVMSRHAVSWITALVVLMAACQAPGSESLSTSTAKLAGTDRLDAGEGLAPGEYIASGNTVLTYQTDNNLVLYQNGIAIWHTGTFGQIPNSFQMQTDCNAVVYNLFGGASWVSGTNGWGSSCFAKVIEGDWFICSGSTRVFSARGSGNCDDTPYVCSQPAFGVPLEGFEQFRVRIESDYLYVCDTHHRYELTLPWPQVSSWEVQTECVGACGAGCSRDTCLPEGLGAYTDMGDGQACRDVLWTCYASDCCLYHDLCGRLFPGSGIVNPFCHVLGIVYGCALCAGDGFPGCSVGGYPQTFFHPYFLREDCICVDRAGDCIDECTGECFGGCDNNFDCLDDCTGACRAGCDANFDCVDDCTGGCGPGCDLNLDCFDDCTGLCAPGCDFNFDCLDDCTGACRSGCDANQDCLDDCTGENWCYGCPDFGRGLCCDRHQPAASTAQDTAVPVVPDLTVHIGSQTKVWRSDELAATPSPPAAMSKLSSQEQDKLSTRSGWSLRELVRSKLGSQARVVAVIGEHGIRVDLDPATWDSTDSEPILRVNRKGELRFQWFGAQKTLPGLKGVKAIQVIAGQPSGAGARTK